MDSDKNLAGIVLQTNDGYLHIMKGDKFGQMDIRLFDELHIDDMLDYESKDIKYVQNLSDTYGTTSDFIPFWQNTTFDFILFCKYITSDFVPF